MHGAPVCAATGDGGHTVCAPTEAEEILERMPVEPDKLAQEILYTDEMIESIGANVLVVERFPVRAHKVPLKEVMSPDDWEEYVEGTVCSWAARMTCTFCGEGFDGTWLQEEGKRAVFVLDFSEDHLFGGAGYGIDGWTERHDRRLEIPTTGAEGSCPCCGRYGVTHTKSWLGKKGKTFRQLFSTAEAFDGYGGIFYWLAELHVDSEAFSMMELLPRDALVVGKDGRLYAFTGRDGVWEPRPLGKRLLGARTYRSALAHGGEARAAAWHTWAWACDTDGTTLEKTGIDQLFAQPDYMTDDPNLPEAYLRFWAEHKAVENLMRQGWTEIALDAAAGWRDGAAKLVPVPYGETAAAGRRDGEPVPYGEAAAAGRRDGDAKLVPVPYGETGLDWSRQKPHEILRLTKAEYRQTEPLSGRELTQYRMYKELWPKQADMEHFVHLLRRYGSRVELLMERAEADRAWDPLRVDRYLERQGMANRDGLTVLADYRTAAGLLNALHTDRDYWPRQLRAMHDETTAAEKCMGAANAALFHSLLAWLEGTAWSDGTFCIRPAASPAELTEEGRVLHHCVGSYAEKMARMTDVIFFVRRARRPERSWLTLDVCMTGDRPTVVQLHGFGNEYNWRTSSTWEVPKKGWDFVNRWMNEVLQPWWDRKQGKVETKRRRTA